MKVAIIDDERKIRDGVFKLIDWDSFGLEVIGRYEDGEVALNAFKNEMPDIVITDIKMPFIDGIELIEECRKWNNKIKFIILSGYDEFSLARKALRAGAVDYLLKPVKKDELESLLSKVAGSINERIVKNIFRELIFEDEANKNLVKNLDYCGITDIRQLMVMVVKTDVKIETQKSAAAVIAAGKYTVIIVSGTNVQDCRQKSEELVCRFPSDSFTGISSATSKPLKLKELYREALNVCLNSSRFSGRKSAEYSALMKFPKAEASVVEEAGLRLFDAVRRFNWTDSEKAVKEIEAVFSDCIVEKSSADFLMSGLFKEGLELIKAQMINADFRKYGAVQNDCDISEIPGIIKNTVSHLFEDIAGGSSRNSRREIRQALQCILENYSDKNLDMAVVANAAGISQGYFSTLFKSETGTSFSDYLCRYRIDISRKLISTGAYRNYEIAELAGFRNSAYFCSVFKKITGLTPGEYRDNLIKLSI